MAQGITRVALQRATVGLEGARHIGSTISGWSGSHVQALLQEAKNAIDSKAASNRGMPAGGTLGKILKKNSAIDYDATWQDDSAGGAASGTRLFIASKEGVPFGAATDATVAMQALVNTVATSGGGTIILDAGELVTGTITLKSGVSFWAPAGRFGTRWRLKTGVNTSIINEGGANTETADNTFIGINFDGDRANSGIVNGTSGAGLLRLYRASRLRIIGCDFRNCRSYGLGLQGRPSEAKGPEQDIYIEDCRFIDNGYEADGTQLSADGIDVKSSRRMTMVHCHAFGNTDKGFNVRGRYVTLLACRATNNVVGFDCNAPSDPLAGTAEYSYFDLHGCVAADNSSSGIAITETENQRTHANLEGCYGLNNVGHGLVANAGDVLMSVNGGGYNYNTGDGVRIDAIIQCAITGITARSNTSDGIEVVNNANGVAVTGCSIHSNTGVGVRSTGTADRVGITGGVIRGNGGINSLVGANNSTVGVIT